MLKSSILSAVANFASTIGHVKCFKNCFEVKLLTFVLSLKNGKYFCISKQPPISWSVGCPVISSKQKKVNVLQVTDSVQRNFVCSFEIFNQYRRRVLALLEGNELSLFTPIYHSTN